MAPRKRARVSEPSTPKPTTASAESGKPTVKSELLNDPWTDDEEILLFKSMIRWKPTGIHKHFRMLAISNALSSHGFTSASTPHTRIPGIWAKLDSLYDLAALDERENSHAGILSSPMSSPDPDAAADEIRDDTWNHVFELPDDEYGDMMWERRFPAKGDQSTESSPGLGVNFTRQEPGLDLSEWTRPLVENLQGELTTVKGKGRKSTATKVVKGKAARSMQSTPADEAEDEEGEDGEEEDESQTPAPASKKPAAKSKARSSRRRR